MTRRMLLSLRSVVMFALGLVILVTSHSARAQCEPEWQAFDPTTASIPGVNGSVYATVMWDPDGAGTLSPKLVVGGAFTLAGSTFVSNIALYDTDTGEWSSLGGGTSAAVRAGGHPPQ